jgi:hypothetical protein
MNFLGEVPPRSELGNKVCHQFGAISNLLHQQPPDLAPSPTAAILMKV